MKISRRAICEYKLGFCPNGPDCRYRHAKLPGPPPQMEKSPITIIKPSGTESANMQQQQQQPNPLNRIATPLPQGISRCVQSSEAISVAAEAKREEEKEKGDNPDNGCENPDIVPFEDNEEAEEESEEEETFGHPLGAAAQGRGRGRGIMGPPHIPISRGARPILGRRDLSQ
ncbi:hypothetical protein DKX38_017477 [Salix brachista]|uniref:C3H1-type domain-containing protein n=1 Tax=Salix brachista TaxID=2182728 RepID=A0A5N5KW79_9ROSI|nr:hypothetical protein DKX38_017477 [Salix brachista]